jgi:hypothetical protein
LTKIVVPGLLLWLYAGALITFAHFRIANLMAAASSSVEVVDTFHTKIGGFYAQVGLRERLADFEIELGGLLTQRTAPSGETRRRLDRSHV